MEKALQNKVDQVIEKHKAIYEDLTATRSLMRESLIDAAHEELRQGEKGSFTWIKDQTFNNKKYKAGDKIKASEIGLNTRGRQVVNMPNLIQPTWHIMQGKQNANLRARIRKLEPDFNGFTGAIKSHELQEKAVEDAKAAYENAKTRLSEIKARLDQAADQLLKNPYLTDPIK